MHNFIWALFFLFLSGLGLLSQFAMMNTTIQHLVEDRYRGRVMSIYTIMFIGLSPLGNLENGYISQQYGTSVAIIVGAIIVFMFGLTIFFRRHRISAAQHAYQENNLVKI